MSLRGQIADGYQPLTGVNRVKDFIVPTTIPLGSAIVNVPQSLLRKDINYIVDSGGTLIRAAYITKALAHILNSYRLEGDAKRGELSRAIVEIDQTISSLVKKGLLRDRQGPGAMAFAQSHENVPRGHILMTKRSFEVLCGKRNRWEKTSHVICVRFPNLGPATTQRLRLIVSSPPPLDNLPPTALGNRADFSSLLDELFVEPNEYNIVDGFYLNPHDLKDGFEGDCDGDTIYIVADGYGKPQFKEISMVRKAGPLWPELTDKEKEKGKKSIHETLLSKSDRCDRSSVSEWLPPYFDNIPIGQVTYGIRWVLYRTLPKYKDAKCPMHEAWNEVSGWGINLAEWAFDIRKGEHTEETNQANMELINNLSAEIREAKLAGDWFAKVVTTSTLDDVEGFIEEFPSLQAFVNLITGQNNGTAVSLFDYLQTSGEDSVTLSPLQEGRY